MPSPCLGAFGTTDSAFPDLSGDDLKVVRWRIIFTRPDLEASFEERTEIVAYSTNGGSLGGIKVAEFIGKVERKEFERPRKWRDNEYPPTSNFPGGDQTPKDEKYWSFPDEDLRYIEFQYEVIRREAKQDPNHGSDRTKDLRDIRAAIEKMAKAEGYSGSGGAETAPDAEGTDRGSDNDH
jgi:hypothetical protein